MSILPHSLRLFFASSRASFRCVGLVCRFVLVVVGTGSSLALGQAPVITQQPVTITVPLGQAATFTYQATGVSQIVWNKDYWQIPGATSPAYTFTPTLADSGHVFSVALLSASGEVTYSQTAFLHVVPRTDVATITNVENFGSAPASQVADSFGLGVDSNQDWEFAAVAAMGGKWVRADGCQWEQVEIQKLPGNTSGGFSAQGAPNCVSQIASSKKYNLHLDSLAYFAPPHGTVATGVVAQDVPAGSMSIPLTVTSGDISKYLPRDLLIYGTSALRERIDYGTPVDSVSGTTLNLPEPSLAAIPAGTPLTISALLYPPVLLSPTITGTGYVSDPSVQAWTRYVAAAEGFLKDAGVTGTVELWNEPEQDNELWDFAPAFYKTPPAHFDLYGTGSYLAYASTTLAPVAGVKLVNGWTDINGFGSLYNPQGLWALPVPAAQVNAIYHGEAIHPYGNNPEQMAWLPSAVKADAANGQQNFITETPIGGQVGANFKSAAYYNQSSYATGGISVSVTESGIEMNQSANETEQTRTRFNIRQFLTFSGLNITPVIFYKAGQDPGYEWFGEDAAHTPAPVVGAFTSLLSDIRSIANAPVTGSSVVPAVTSYTGYYPLATTSFFGSRPGDHANSILFYTWQKTFTTPQGGGTGSENYGNSTDGTFADMPRWMDLPSPPPVTLTLTLPGGYTVAAVKDLVTLMPVKYSLQGTTLSYPVADNPIQVMLTPGSLPSPVVTVAKVSVPYGSATGNVSSVVSYSSTVVPAGAFTFQADSSAPVAGACIPSTASLLCSTAYPVSTLLAGDYTLTGSLAGDANFASATGSSTLTILPVSPTLVAENVASTAGAIEAELKATLAYPGLVAPAGGVTFQVGANGPVLPALCTGNISPLVCVASYPLASRSAGALQIQVVSPMDRNYLSVSAMATLTLPEGNAIAGSHVWIANGNGTLSALTDTGKSALSYAISGGGRGLAVDAGGNAWSLNSTTGTLTQFANTGAILQSGIAAGGIVGPAAFTIDGAGALWVVNSNNTLSNLDSSGVAIAPQAYLSEISGPSSIHADGSGNLWITNASDDSVTQVIGIATPVVTSQAIAVRNGTATAKP